MNPLISSLALVPAVIASATAAPFVLNDGDRVVLLGDAFIEREQYEGWIEMAATTQFPDRRVSFRNLGWSADTPAGDSRNGLSLLQAGLEPPDEGWRQLLNQIQTYRPNVIILGYGMAASLPNGSSPEKFREDLLRLLNEAPKQAGNEVRYIILGVPPRFAKQGEDVQAHRESIAKIDRILKETAENLKVPFVSFDALERKPEYSQNGIHLTGEGYRAVARHLEKSLGWKPGAWDRGEGAAVLRQHILKKNEWFFHRSRPANMAYIFGFRRAEQGNNAKEIPQFDALIAEQEETIAKMRDLSKKVVVPPPPVRTESAFAKKVAQAHPAFTVQEGYEISLWAENPMMHKPTQMNFDAAGRLWVASSETYPQVEVGQTPNDKIIVLSDTDGDGKADHSEVFADGMLMPTAVLPGDGGVYVGQSTDLLHFKDTNGDGKADVKTRVLSGFGTEDTHHNIHTLRRGPDGRLWFNQSIYTRTDTETPHGVFRLKSGGIMRFDPRDSKLEAVFYGWCNPWGHQFDAYGQSFVTDGAGGGGINWGVPGAMYFTYAKAPKTLGSISPGSYPKFSGLEIIDSPHFPEDWQGNMITCDFRAHRIVRFGVADQGSGFAAQELSDLVRTNDVNFRPIDVKIGPDGALYVADWSNPIINHGEVDFRDPRRDREHGRIWKITRKGVPLAKPRDFTRLPDAELFDALSSGHRFEKEQASVVLFEKGSAVSLTAEQKAKSPLAALWLAQGANRRDLGLLKRCLGDPKGEVRAAAVRVLGDWVKSLPKGEAATLLKQAIEDEHPRVRIEAIRVLAKIPGAAAMDLALSALDRPRDPFIDYALWLNVEEHGEEWLAALLEKKLDVTKREKALEFVLANLPPAKSTEAISRLLPKPLPRNGSGPWLALALEKGNGAAIGTVLNQVISGGFDREVTVNALQGIARAVSQRQVRPEGDLKPLAALLNGGDAGLKAAALGVIGVTIPGELLPAVQRLAIDSAQPLEVRTAAADVLGNYPTAEAREALLKLAAAESPAPLREQALLALARHHRAEAVPLVAAYVPELKEAEQARHFWQRALSLRGMSGELAKAFGEKPLPAEMAVSMLQYIPDVPDHDALLKALKEQAGSAQKVYDEATIRKMAKEAEEKGDAARGERVYRRMAMACVACHSIGGAGGKVGPDMTSLGASAPLDYIIESVVHPGAKIKEGYHSVTVETKDGRSIMGQLIRSGGSGLTVRDAAGQEIVIPESNVAKKIDAGSLMPGNLIASLPESEVNDLFKFLSQLGKPGDYDATKSRAPKIWAVTTLTTAVQEKGSQGDPGLPWFPVNATVNGRLLPEDVKMAAPGAQELLIGTKLQLAADAKVSLGFDDGFKPTAIWIDGVEAGNGEADLGAGVHKIVLRVPAADRELRMTCDAGTFLPEW